MKITLSKSLWQKIGKTAGWWDNNDKPKSNPAKTEKDIDFSVCNKWLEFQKDELTPAMDKAMIEMQNAITNKDKSAYEKAESGFDWAKNHNDRANSEIKRLKEKHDF